MYFLKPIEQGLDVKFTGGIHRGCLRVQVANNSNINSIADLKSKRIGVPGLGTPPFIFAQRTLRDNGIDAGKHLDGVTDKWIEQLQVEKVTGGQLPQKVEDHTISQRHCLGKG